jgi:hypothetical protein
MAQVSIATNVSNQDATPIVKVLSQDKGGVLRTAVGYIAAANLTGGTVGQWYTFARVPARARIVGIYLTNPTTTTGAVKFGLYRPGAAGIAISDAVFSTVTVMGQANNRANVVTAMTPAQKRDPLATAYTTAVGTAGATSDVEYDIAAAIVTVIGTPQDAYVEVDYVLPE